MPGPFSRSRNFRVLISLVVVVPFLAIACGGKGPAKEPKAAPSTGDAIAPAPPAVAAAPAAVRDPCEMITAEELLAATGIEGQGRSSSSGNAKVCTWVDATGRSVVVQVFPTASSYEQSRKAFESLYGAHSEDLPGLGDEAFYVGGVTSSIPTATISVRKGETVAGVQVLGMGQDPATLKDQALALTRMVMGKL